VQGVRRLREKVSVVYLSRIFGGLVLRDSAESKESRTVEVFAGLPQGVRANDFLFSKRD